ncbi:MAG: SGNH/GDSL hydrolase family protein [Desulfuromonadales bacterium]
MRRREITYIATAAVILTLALLLLGEVITRVLGVTVVYGHDSALGWRPKPDFAGKIPVIDQTGEKYLADYSTNEFGFRTFGDLHGGKKRILFVGDSWTGDPNTSDAEAYFGIVQRNLPVEVFAIGGGGYGTLQELLLLKEFARMIKPDIFVLQYCDNDIVNNSFFLEGPSITRSQKNFRPYWVDGKVRHRLSATSPYLLLHRFSRLFRTLDALLSTAQYKVYNSYYPPPFQAYDGLAPATSPAQQAEIAGQKAAAVQTTEFLMAEMKRALPPGTHLVTFSASSDDPQELQIWHDLAAQTGFAAYPSVSRRVEEAEAAGQIVRVRDGAHWNRLGNRIAGEELAAIIARDFLDKTDRQVSVPDSKEN